MTSALCPAEAKGLADTLQLLSSKQQEKITKLLAQGHRTLANLNETNRSNFHDSYKEYKNLCAKIEEKADSFRAKMLVIVAQKGGQASEDDEVNLNMSRELLVQEDYFPEELEALFENIGAAWETYQATAATRAQAASAQGAP